jgi:hypothetical protein
MQVKLLEPQLVAYRKLWAMMGVASPSLTGELTEDERTSLEGKFRDWYYESGNGIFMSVQSRKLLVDAKKHLLNFQIKSVPIRTELSNLRSQMKNDIGVYGKEDIGLAGSDTPHP